MRWNNLFLSISARRYHIAEQCFRFVAGNIECECIRCVFPIARHCLWNILIRFLCLSDTWLMITVDNGFVFIIFGGEADFYFASTTICHLQTNKLAFVCFDYKWTCCKTHCSIEWLDYCYHYYWLFDMRLDLAVIMNKYTKKRWFPFGHAET